jgi:hypothetical protein
MPETFSTEILRHFLLIWSLLPSYNCYFSIIPRLLFPFIKSYANLSRYKDFWYIRLLMFLVNLRTRRWKINKCDGSQNSRTIYCRAKSTKGQQTNVKRLSLYMSVQIYQRKIRSILTGYEYNQDPGPTLKNLCIQEKIFFQENVWEKVWTFLHGLKRNVPIVKMLKKANFLSQVLKFFIEDTSYRRSDQKFNEIKSGSVRISQDQSGSVRISQDQSGSGTTTLTETVTQIPRSSFNAGPGWPQQRK